jgi:hypothetical protein
MAAASRSIYTAPREVSMRRTILVLTVGLSIAGASASCSGEVANAGGGGSGIGTTSAGGASSASTAVGTGGASSSSSTGTGQGGGASLPGLPPPGPLKPADGAGSKTFAFSKLYLGDTKRDGTPDKANGWKEFGYDLDGKISLSNSNDLCKPRSNASPSNVYPDGNDGIDNSFGKNVLPILLGIQSDFSYNVNQTILDGSFTALLDLEKLGADADYNPIHARFYHGSDLGKPPSFDGSDAWPIAPELLVDPADVGSAKFQFPQSYLANDIWVSGAKGSVLLKFEFAWGSFMVPIQSAYVSMELDATHTSAKNGTIAGVLGTEAFLGALKEFFQGFDPAFCDPNNPTMKAILTQIEQASDILQDGTQDPSKTCDGISIGLGFDAAAAKLGPIAPPAMVGPDPCTP